MASTALIDACYMWCVHHGLEPIVCDPDITGLLVRRAVREYRGTITQLNDRQRRIIAGASR